MEILLKFHEDITKQTKLYELLVKNCTPLLESLCNIITDFQDLKTFSKEFFVNEKCFEIFTFDFLLIIEKINIEFKKIYEKYNILKLKIKEQEKIINNPKQNSILIQNYEYLHRNPNSKIILENLQYFSILTSFYI